MKYEFEFLRKYYGSHSAAARALGVSVRAYRYYRSGKKPPKSKAKMIRDHVLLLRIREP